MILPTLKHPDPRLLETAIRIRVFDSELRQLARDMLETMYSLGGCGLAAPQVGIGLRLIVFNFGPRGVGSSTERVMVNPEWDAVGARTSVMGEMCLSCPDVVRPVSRFKTVRASWMGFEAHDRDSRETFRGWAARVLQHEVDHLDGKVIAQ